ncbi:hypothetical protein [Paraburkholderia sp. GAS32]|uniref:hypothetical protein n=1 Tax=Paraburkholderia sp. GAS32 TaxID=3035129 RepID=UPI003D221465
MSKNTNASNVARVSPFDEVEDEARPPAPVADRSRSLAEEFQPETRSRRPAITPEQTNRLAEANGFRSSRPVYRDRQINIKAASHEIDRMRDLAYIHRITLGQLLAEALDAWEERLKRDQVRK